MHCSKCKRNKKPIAFNKSKTLTRGRAYWCRQCSKEYQTGLYKPGEHATYMREYRAKKAGRQLCPCCGRTVPSSVKIKLPKMGVAVSRRETLSASR